MQKEQKAINTSFSIDSDIKKIDDRSVILNFYSEMKKQYIDIELPRDIYNFLQTYLPEKKYGIVDELEKKTIVHQSTDIIGNGRLLKVDIKSNISSIGQNELNDSNLMEIKYETGCTNIAEIHQLWCEVRYIRRFFEIYQ